MNEHQKRHEIGLYLLKINNHSRFDNDIGRVYVITSREDDSLFQSLIIFAFRLQM